MLVFGLNQGIDDKSYNINDFKRSYFKIINKDGGFYDVTTGMENEESKDILTTGYLNNDLNVDILLTDTAADKLTFMVYDEKGEGTFSNQGTFVLDKKSKDHKIIGTHFIEVEGLASPEKPSAGVVVISQYEDEKTAQSMYMLKGYVVMEDDSGKLTTSSIDGYEFSYVTGVDRGSEPLNFQLFTDKKEGKVSTPDVKNYWLIVQNSQRFVLTFDLENKKMITNKFSDLFDVTLPSLESKSNDDPEWLKNRYFLNGGSFHFMDLNFDCRADIMIETMDRHTSKRYLEFYYFTGSDGKLFKLINRTQIGDGLSSPVLVDFRQSNALDLTFYNPARKELNIFLNKGPASENTEEIVTYCSKGNNDSVLFPFDGLTDGTVVPEKSLLAYSIPLGVPLYENLANGLELKESLQFADLDLNGYPDLITVVNEEIGNNAHLVLFNNRECTAAELITINPDEKFKSLCRMLDVTPYNKFNLMLEGQKMHRLGLFDLGERGYVGFFLITYVFGKF